jgi:hypothetical protein
MTRIRNPERGSAMLVTLIVTSALIAGAAVLASTQMASTRGSSIARNGLQSLYCAEAGLAMARPWVMAQYQVDQWKSSLTLSASGTASSAWEENWLSGNGGSTTGINTVTTCTNYGTTGGCHDLGTPTPDGAADFFVYIVDNNDDLDQTTDQDQTVWIVSRCTRNAETVQEVRELVRYSGGGTHYNDQAGGASGNGNAVGGAVQ